MRVLRQNAFFAIIAVYSLSFRAAIAWGQAGSELPTLLAEIEASQQINMGESDGLTECLIERERRAGFAHQQFMESRRIEGNIARLNGPITMQLGHKKQAEHMPGASFDPTVLNGLLNQQRELHIALANQERLRAQTTQDNAAFDKPVLEKFNRFQSAYGAARKIIRKASQDELNKLAAILEQHRDQPAAIVLLASVTIRGGAEPAQLVDELERIAPELQSSPVMGMSDINLDRILYSILLESNENTDATISKLKKDNAAMKHAGVLYVVGTHFAANGKFADATRHIRNARNRMKRESFEKGLLAAEIIFYEFCKGDWKEEKNQDLLNDVVNIPNDQADLEAEWRIQRAMAALASLAGNEAEMTKRIDKCRTISPPLALRQLLDATSKVKPDPKLKPIGID